MPNVIKAPLNTEFAKKICKEQSAGTSAGVKTTPRRLIEPKNADSFANKLIFGNSAEKTLAALTKYINTAIS